MQSARQINLIRKLNPIIRGWVNYHRHVVSKRTFTKIDHAIEKALSRWAKRRHPKKSKYWAFKKYFHAIRQVKHRFCVTERNEKTGKPDTWKLILASYTPIVRHTKIMGKANPFDPEFKSYFEKRLSWKMALNKAGKQTIKALWSKQSGFCPFCGDIITSVFESTIQYLKSPLAGGTQKRSNLVLVHNDCHGRSPPEG